MFISSKIQRFLAIGLGLGLFCVRIYPVEASAQDFYSQPYLNQINTVSNSANGAVVAVIDEGIDLSHPDLQGNIWQGSYTDSYGQTIPISSWDFWNNQPDAITYGTHGTEVAGVIKATAGANSNIQLMSLAVCKRGYGCDVDKIVSAIYFAVDHNAQVINISLSTPGYGSSFNQAITYAYNHNVVVVAAAGNASSGSLRGANLNTNPVSPACNDGSSNMVIGVSGINASGRVPSWANYGGCIDVYAPATDIYTLTDPAWDNGLLYSYDDGTSFAAPQVAAVAALLKADNPQMTSSQVTDLITSESSKTSGLAMLNVGQVLSANQNLAFQSNIVPKANATIEKKVVAMNKVTGFIPVLPRG